MYRMLMYRMRYISRAWISYYGAVATSVDSRLARIAFEFGFYVPRPIARAL